MLNMNFNESKVIHTADKKNWVQELPDPLYRVRLENDTVRKGDGTAIVHYPPGSSFPSHGHPGGEEILVLEGVFQDEHGDYPEGTYLRNPAGSKHMPFSRLGCTIFVKLGRFMKDDTAQKNLQTSQQKWLPQKTNPGIKEMLLHSHQGEKTLFIKVSPNTEFEWCHKGKGEEILIINGELHEGQHIYPKGTWLRFGEGGLRKRYTKSNETILFMKTGHLVR